MRSTPVEPLRADRAAASQPSDRATLGREAPNNAALVRLVRAAGAGGRRDYRGAELARELGIT